MKLLERQTVIQNVQDGASINFQACHKTNGKLWGCVLSTANQIVSISAGVLVVRGFRIVFDANDVIYDGSSVVLPSTETLYYMKLRLTVADNNANYVIVTDTSTASNATEIEKVDGIFDYLLGTFKLSTAGLGSLASSIAAITSSGSSSSEISPGVPVPRLNMVTLGSVYNGVLVLENAADYAPFMADYTVRFELMRKISKGRYRISGSTPAENIWKKKSGLVRPIQTTTGAQLGWQKTLAGLKFKLALAPTDLKSVTLTQGLDTIDVGNVIEVLKDYIDTMFFDNGETYDSVRGCMVRGTSRTAITVYTNPRNIRCSRSRRPPGGGKTYSTWLGAVGAFIKYNAFEFTYRAVLLNAQGTRIAESDVGKVIKIYPSVNAVKWSSGNHTGVAYVDNVSKLFGAKVI